MARGVRRRGWSLPVRALDSKAPHGYEPVAGYAFLRSPPQDYVAAAVDLSRIAGAEF